jgi:hypothetical protein
VAAELKWAKENFPEVKEFFFDDDTFNIQKVRTIELCEKLKPLGMTWSCTSRVTTDYDTLKAMKEAGCRLLIVGFESGDPQILKNIKKGATVERARDFAKDCHDLGLTIHADFILGLPGETKESIRNTINFAKTAGLRDHPGVDCARVSGHGVLRLRQGERLHHQREHGRRRRPPDGAHRVSRPADRLRDGDGAPLLRRVLLPAQGGVPRGVEGDCEPRCAAALCEAKSVPEAARAAQQVAAVFTPWIALGIALLIGFFASYLTALSWADLTFVLPATAFGNVLVALCRAVLAARDHFALSAGRASRSSRSAWALSRKGLR